MRSSHSALNVTGQRLAMAFATALAMFLSTAHVGVQTPPLWGPTYPHADADEALTISYVYAWVAGNRFAAKIAPWPANGFACSGVPGIQKVTVDPNNPKFKQIWAQLTTANALGQRVNVYVFG